MEELRILRRELLNLKDCITKYLGYIFAGSAGSVFGLLRLSQISDRGIQFAFEGIGLISLVLSLIISFISIIFFYKFHSHNRIAGYCKVISHERLPKVNSDNGQYKSIFGWESIIGRLRDIEMNPKKVSEIFPEGSKNVIVGNKKLGDIQDDIEKVYSKTGCEAKYGEAIKILFQSITGKLRTYSWAFPPFITAICLITDIIFYLTSVYIAVYTVSISLIVFLLITTFILFPIWLYLLKKLDRLMKGDLTIDSYMLKCLPLRIEYLRQFNLNPTYTEVKYINPCKQ